VPPAARLDDFADNYGGNRESISFPPTESSPPPEVSEEAPLLTVTESDATPNIEIENAQPDGPHQQDEPSVEAKTSHTIPSQGIEPRRKNDEES
jgi:hypothetical protein